ncbi:MAG TPA: hypothetical protein VLJ58_08745 [Ramlibacter sp.]|nr:hypothetical protein [Ramlibacter sp.]
MKRLAILVGLVVPAMAWALVKPVRVAALEFADVRCFGSVCVDVDTRAQEAAQLLSDAQEHVEKKVGPLRRTPKVIFCASQACADYFGLGARSAVTVGTVATVIGPRAWKPYYVRHELLHHAQGDHIGVVPLLFKPGWIVEGMAYGLSEDPRAPLSEPFETQRREFLAWYARIDPQRIWTELAKQ